jgi:hypothetical protein
VLVLAGIFMPESEFKAVANGKEINNNKSSVNTEERIQPIEPTWKSLLMPFNPALAARAFTLNILLHL